MSKSQVGAILDHCIRLVEMAGSNTEIPAGEHEFELSYLSGAMTAGDVDWAIYYINILTSRTASAVGHLGIDVGPEFMDLLRAVISEKSSLRSVLRDGDAASLESLQKQLEEWQQDHGVQPEPHRDERSPLMAR